MSKRYRSLPEDEIQDYLAQAQQGLAGVNPRAQTLARSGSRAGQQMVDAQLEQNQANRDKLAQEAERQAQVSQRQETDQAREAQRAAKAEDARRLRQWDAAGAQIVTDVPTGKRTVATHPDGAVKYEAGPVKGAPMAASTATSAIQNKDGTVRAAPASNPMIPGDGALGATGGVTQTKLKQPVRNDRGQVSYVEPDSKTDKATGVQYVEGTDPATGQKVKQAVGVDIAAKDAGAQAADMKLRTQEIALRENQLKQARMRFNPQWEPVNDKFTKASKALNDYPQTFRRNATTGKMEKIDPKTNSAVPYDPRELAVWQQQRTDLENQHATAKAKYDKLYPYAENLNRVEKEAAEAKLKLAEDRIRAESGLPAIRPLDELLAASPAGITKDEHNRALLAELGIQEPSKKQMRSLEDDALALRGTNRFRETLAAMDIEAVRVQRDLSTGAIDPVEAERKTQLIAAAKQQTVEQAKAQAAAELEAKGREIAAGFIGTGTAAQRISQNEPGAVASVKGAANEYDKPQDWAAEALRSSGGDIDKAIKWAQDRAKGSRVPTPAATGSGLLPPMIGGMAPGESPSAQPLRQAAEQLAAMKAAMEKAGVAPKDRPRIIQDAARSSAWTENDGDNLRKLSTGDLVINPGRVFGQKEALLAEISASDVTPQAKASAVTRLDAMREAMAGKIFRSAVRFDDNFEEFASQQYKAGNQDKAAILDLWSAQQKDRNWLFKATDAVTEGIKTGSTGITKTVIGGAAGIAAAFGADATAAGLGQKASDVGALIQGETEAAKLRGMTGGYGITSDLTNTVVQMSPMILGGNLAMGMKGFSAVATRGASVYGWAAAQGYESKLSDSLDMAAQAKGSALTSEEIAGVLGSTETQVAAFLNGAQTAILAAAFPRGAESVALGKQSASMTISDFLRKGGTRAIKDGTLRQEIKAIGKNIFADAKDEALEEFSNQVLDGMISVAALNKDMLLGDLLADSFKAGALGGLVGGGLPQFYRGQSKADRHKQMLVTLQNETLGKPNPDMVSTALATIDPQAKAPDVVEIKAARQLVGANITSLKALEERRVAYEAAIAAKDYKGAAAIEAQINETFTKAQSEAAQDVADAVLLTRELAGLEEQASEALWNADEALTKAKMSGDKTAIAQAEANLEQVEKTVPKVPLVRAAVKLGTGQNISALTDAELRAVGYKAGKPDAEGKVTGYVPMSSSELAAEGLSKPMIRVAADGSAVILDEAVQTVVQTSGMAANRIKLGEQEAMQAAQARADAAKQSPQTPNEQNPQGPEGKPPQASQPAPANAQAPGGGTGTVQQPAAAGSAPAAGTAGAAVEAAVYEAARQQDPSLPEIPARVAEAFSAGQPVSVSMQKASGIDVPEGYARQGNVWNPPAGQTVSKPGQTVSEVPAGLEQAASVAEEVKTRVEAAMPALAGRISIISEQKNTGGADIVIETGEIRLSLPDIQRAITSANGDVAAITESLENIVARHEAVHVVQVEAVRSDYEAAKAKGYTGSFIQFFEEFYTDLAKELLTTEALDAARKIYGKKGGKANFDNIPTEWQKAAEFVRMLVEAKLDGQTGQFSELFRAIKTRGAKSKIAKMIRKAIEVLTGMKLSPAAEQHVAKLKELYAELTAPAENAETKAKPAESAPKAPEIAQNTPEIAENPAELQGLRIENTGETARILNGNEVLWEGSSDQAQAELSNLKAAQESPMKLVGDAIKAAQDQFPKITRGKLAGFFDNILAEVEALPAGERMAGSQRAVADRINAIADAEAERTGKKREEIIEGFRAVAGKRASKQAASIEAAVVGQEAPEIPAGKQERRDTPNSEMTVDVTSTFVDLDQLVGSSDPLFPGGALQPRNRSTQASQNQREEMVQNIRDKDDQHRRYIEGATTDSGRMVIAPLFGADGKHMTNEAGKPLFYVLSGNGRRNALQEAANRKVSGKVMKGFRETAASEGIDVDGITLPVPVSIFVPKSSSQAIDLAEFSNRDAQLSVSNTEQANRDAASIEKAGILKLWETDASGDAGAASNRAFVRGFARAVGDEGIIDGRGELTDEGAKRIERSMVAMLLGPEQAPLLDILFNQSGTYGLRAILGGIASETGSLLKLAASKPDFDLSPVLADALRTAVQAKAALVAGEIRDVGEFFDQGNLFEPTDNTTPERQLARSLVESRSRKAVRDILMAYRRGAEAVDTSTLSMFAEAETTREDLILKALEARPIEQVIAEVEAEFGAKADLPAKLRVGIPGIKKLDAGQRREFVAAVNAEVDRLRSGGISAEEWQKLNPDALSAKAAFFQRWIDSHTPETIASGFNRLLSQKAQAVLGSSPESSAPRKHLGIPRKNMPQIPINRRGRFSRWMVSQGIGLTVRETSANEVGPTQSDLSDAALKGSRKHTRTRNVLVSSDGYILDGHHQWAVAKETGKKFTAVWFDLPVREALAKMKQFEREDYDSMVGTDYENEEYMYLGEATENWRNSPDAEASIVNPINENLSPDEKVDALLALAMDNVSVVQGILADLGQSMGLEGKYSLKLPERIQAKASRPSIRNEKPWHDIEHVRDGLRFKVSMQNFDQLPAIAETLRRHGVEVIKFDTAKMFKPKAWGWRFVAFDLRMPNGQLVEFYAPVPELDSKDIKGPNHKLFEKWRNVSDKEIKADPAKEASWLADILESKNRYDTAFMAGIRRMGYATLEEAEASWNHFVAVASSTSENFSMSSTAVGTRSDLTQSPALERKNAGTPGPVTKASPLSASPASREGFEVEDGLDTDGAFTTKSRQIATGTQDNSGSTLGSSPAPELDLFAGLEADTFGPRAKVKRNAAETLRKAPDKAKPNVAKAIAKAEGLADLDLFAAAAVSNLDAKPRKSESVPDGSAPRQPGNPLDPRLHGGQPTKGTRGPRTVGADQDLFDFSGRPGAKPGSQAGQGAASDVQGAGTRDGGSGNGSPATNPDIGGGRPGNEGSGSGQQSGQADSGNAGQRKLTERQRPDEGSPDRNFTIGKDTVLAEGGAITRIRNNIAAIDLLRTLESENRNATPEEKAILAKFVGWGGLPQVFDEENAIKVENGEATTRRQTATKYEGWGPQYANEVRMQREQADKIDKWNEKWGDYYRQIQKLLTPDEWESARESIINAHFTSPPVISGMWDAVKRLGFRGGNVLEPAGGIGHFFGIMPADMVGRSRQYGIEMDRISGRIMAKLYPEADVEVTPFQETTLPDNSQDLVISNVPFANINVSDEYLDAQEGAPKFNLHNYFFERALRMARPGGLVAFISTANTMDSQITQRKWLAERSDFMGAIRLPNNAFKGNANTEVVTDIIFLRKPDGSPNPMAAEPWTSTEKVQLDTGDSIEINEYFARHPEMILGRLADDGSMYGGKKEMTVHSNGDLVEQLRAAVENLPENVVGEGQAGAIERLSIDNRTAKDGAFIEEDGKIRIKGSSEPVPTKELGKVRAFMKLRDTLNDLYAMEGDPEASDAAIAAQRKALNSAYDGFKAIYKQLHESKNKSLLETDPDFYRTLGLEVPVGQSLLRKQEYRKADVFSKRVLKPQVEPTTAENIEDAVLHSFRWKGRMDAGYIGSLLGITRDEAEARLLATEFAYRDPTSGKVEHATTYLAGNVRRKLRDAEMAAKKDPAMQRNVDALKAALPEDVGWSDINFKMGSAWIPSEMYERFLAEKLFDGRFGKAKIIYNKGVGDLIGDSFIVQQGVTGYAHSIDMQWGTTRKSATEIAEALLNQRDPRVNDTIDKKTVYNAAETDKARQAAARMQDAFQEWVASSPDVQEALHRIYNESFNSHVVPKYDGSFMQLPWVASDFDLYPDKKHVVWRALQEGTLLVAHGVGGGKTIIGTAIAMEARRLGLAKKPLIVVHNATLEQFATTISRMAPTARVLVARKADLEGPKRKEFMGRVRSGDWDAVVMAHSTFDLIPDDPAWERKQINDLIKELEDAIREQGGNPDENDLKKIKDPSVKELVKMRSRLRERMSKLQDRRTDDVLNFQELGIDAMIVDEVHRYKKQPFVTRQSNIAGIDTGFSKRGSAMQLRAKWVQAINQGRGVFTMTGTPVTNTLGESWNMVRLVRPDLLKEFGVKTFDRFVSAFGNIKQSGELRPNGQYKPVTRLSEFTNIPEWNRFWGLAADVKMGEDMEVKGRPRIKGGKALLTAVERTPQVKAIIDEISKVIDAYDAMTGKEKHENQHIPLLTYNAARMAAIDVRLINPEAKDEEGSKVNTALKNVMRLYTQTTADKGTQVIFSDSYRPLRTTKLDLSAAEFERQAVDENATDEYDDGEGFNLYHDIREKLVKAGVPRSEIAIIGEMKNDKQREALFARVNSGEVRIIMGSTETLGTGVNMQERMIAAHHLDVPWTPAGLEQRDGRVYRQGNMWAELGDGEIEIMRYGMKDTLDAALWQKLETKERMIKQAVSGKVNARVIEDDAGLLNYMEQKAALSGADGMLKFTLDEDVRNLKNEWRAHRNRQFDLQRQSGYSREAIERADKELPNARRVAKVVYPLVVAVPSEIEWTFEDGEALKGEDARKALDVLFKERRKKAGAIMNPEKAESVREPIHATANGVPMLIEWGGISEDLANAANPDLRWQLFWFPRFETETLKMIPNSSPHPGSVINQTPTRAQSLSLVPDSLERDKAQAEKDLALYADEQAKPFTKSDNFRKALVDQAALYRRMGLAFPESSDVYAAAIGEDWQAVLDRETAPKAAETSPRSETPANYPGRGLAPAMQTLGSSPAEDIGWREVFHSGSMQDAYDPTKADMDAQYGPGFYTAESSKRAKSYGKVEPRKLWVKTSKTFDHDARISRIEANRIVATMEKGPEFLNWLYDDETASGTPVIGEDVWNALKDELTPLLANEALQMAGYDSATYTGNRGKDRDWIVFKPEQIKTRNPSTLGSSPAPWGDYSAQPGPHKSGFEIRARNIVEGFMSPEFKYQIGNDFRVPEGRKLIASDFAEYKEGKYKLGLYRLLLLENPEGQRYVEVEKGIGHNGGTTGETLEFERISNDAIDRNSALSDRSRKLWEAHPAGQQQASLFSSPAPESDPVQVALAKMPPIHRKVFEDIEAGDSPSVVMKRHGVSEKAVTNILNQVRARIAVATAAAADALKPAMQGDQFAGGRPDLALSTNPAIAAVDQARNEFGVPDVRGWDEVNKQAADMLAADYQGTYDMLLDKARDLQPMTDKEVAAAKMIISRETLSGKIDSPADRIKLGMMIYGYREIGSETARSLAIRRDPHLRPAERHAQFIAEALFTPDQRTRKRMKDNPKAAETILAGWMKRVDAIEAELLAQGIDIRAALAEFNETQEARKQSASESPQTQAVIDEQIRKLNRQEKAVIEAIRSGALVSKAAFTTGLSTDEVKEIYGRFMKDIRSAMAESAKRYLAGTLASSPVDMMGEILADLGLPDISAIDDTAPDFVDRRGEKPRAPRKPRKAKPAAPKAPKPEGVELTPEQQEALDEAWERFLAAPPNKQRIFWQEEAGIFLWTQEQFDSFMEKTEGIARDWSKQKDLLTPREEVSTTTGTFDIHDPLSVKRVIDAFGIARGDTGDAIMEFWRASILTGPQTHIVNTSSNLLNLAYNALPRRAAEATINTLLGTVGQGSDKAATFSEFAPMARHLRQAATQAARNALRSWQAETRVFESYASAEALQLDFSGVKAEYIPPALGGKLGKVMRSLSFRAMTATDEFVKTLYGTMEAAAQAHRIAAKEEKLTGQAYEKRFKALMEPGSVAWIRAIDGAKLITFQTDLDGSKPQLLNRIDQLAEAAKRGRNMPWLGKPLTFFLPFIDTPTNIFKMGVEMSPLGTFVAVVDGARALRRRIFAGDLTPAEAQAEAAKLYDRARLVRDLTNQTIAWTVFFALQGLVGGGDDDDEMPWITGTVPYKTTKRGERDNAYAVMPPTTIRLPGGIQFSYNRFEPFSVALSSMVDLISIAKKNGGYMTPGAGSEWLSRFKDAAKDKTFLQGISALMDAFEDPDRFGERLVSNIATGFVPNIIRQPLRESDKFIRNSNPQAGDGFFTAVGKRIGYSLVPQAAPAKIDVWGNKIMVNRGDLVGGTRATEIAFRILDPTNAQLNPQADPIDRWIFRWNQRTADDAERVAIMPIQDRITLRVPGQKKPETVPLSADEWHAANREAGQMARQILGDGWDKLPLSVEHAERITKTVRDAQSIVRANIRQKKLAELAGD